MNSIQLSSNKSFEIERIIHDNEEARTKVFLVRDGILKRRVLLKKLSYNTKDEKETIFQEIRAQINLEQYSDSIPRLYNHYVCDKEKCIYIEMQFVNGKSLRDIIDDQKNRKKDKPWFDKNYDLIMQICGSVSFIHACKEFVHKDLKPENIIINSNKRAAYIIDFGISGPEGMSKGVGTPKYMAPEQYQQGNTHFVTQSTDVFALAQIAVEMFTGEPLSIGNELVVSKDKSKWGYVRSIDSIGGDYYPSLGKIITKALSYNPNERYSDAKDFYYALKTGKRNYNERKKGNGIKNFRK